MKLSVATIACLALAITTQTAMAVAPKDSLEKTAPPRTGVRRRSRRGGADDPSPLMSSIHRPNAGAGAATATLPSGRMLQTPAMRMMVTRTPTRRPRMMQPTRQPTRKNIRKPTRQPTRKPTPRPKQTRAPSHHPTVAPTHLPSRSPTVPPTQPPSAPPSRHPTLAPTMVPTQKPTAKPSLHPTVLPTQPPTKPPTRQPTVQPEHPFCRDTKLFPSNGHRYALSKDLLTYGEALKYAAQLPTCCGGKKAQLVTIHSHEETMFLVKMLHSAFSSAAWTLYNGWNKEITWLPRMVPAHPPCAYLTSTGSLKAEEYCKSTNHLAPVHLALVEYDCKQ